MADMNEFLELAHRAGIGTLNSLAIAEALEISTSYVAKLRSGAEPLRPPVRAKLDALIAAKADGPAESPYVLEHGEFGERDPVEVDMQAPQPMPVRRPKYQVIKVSDGYAVVENPIAVFRGLSWAEEYAHWLNEQIRRGKEPG